MSDTGLMLWFNGCLEIPFVKNDHVSGAFRRPFEQNKYTPARRENSGLAGNKKLECRRNKQPWRTGRVGQECDGRCPTGPLINASRGLSFDSSYIWMPPTNRQRIIIFDTVYLSLLGRKTFVNLYKLLASASKTCELISFGFTWKLVYAK